MRAKLETMLLLTGPAGSGKTFQILERLRAALRRRDPGVRLLTPTATMAQHLQNRMAHEGFVFRPALIQTLSRFVDSFAGGPPQVSEPLLYLIVEEAARRANRPEFARVVRLPGFCAALARSLEEFSSAGCDADRLAAGVARLYGPVPLGEAFAAVYREVDRELARRGLATRSERLVRAAERIGREGLGDVHTIWLDGFHALPDPEIAVIGALCRRADVTLTLPATGVTEPTRQRLLAMGFTEEVCTWPLALPVTELCAAPSIEREADEIARRVLEQAAAGRAFREIGVILRSPDIYEPVLRATFDRFGIPARFYFDGDLTAHAVVRYLAGIVDAMLEGWEHAATLAAIRLAPGLECDAFDFAVREKMPGSGLAPLRRFAADAESPALGLIVSLEKVDDWRTLSATPSEWATRLAGLRDLFAPGWLEPSGFESAAMARGQAAALELFGGAMEEAARALPDRPVLLADFWHTAKSVLRLTPLRVDDARRNVVHVLGAHEARQWRLPVIFVCGVVEKQFPKFHTQDPFFPDAARAQLKQAGIRVRTAADFEMEERFLFDSATARATASLTLSYPLTDARGQQTLPSLYLEGLTPVGMRPVSPRAGEAPLTPSVVPAIAAADLRQAISAKHAAFQPTSLECYLQCPFQFFGRDTLRLRGAPLRPEERLDYRTQGSIVHGVLAELHRDGLPLVETFERVFERVAKRNNLVPGYRTEALRERMLADLRGLVEDPRWSLGCEVRAEQEFQYNLAGDVEIKGRIDRIDVTPDHEGYVIDYKYSGAQNTKSRATDANLVQPQLYMRALDRNFNLRPKGMSYWGLKGGIQQTDWIPYEPAVTIETTLRIVAEIRAGSVAPHPANMDKCRLCDFRDVCRFVAEAPALVEAEGESAWD